MSSVLHPVVFDRASAVMDYLLLAPIAYSRPASTTIRGLETIAQFSRCVNAAAYLPFLGFGMAVQKTSYGHL